MMTQAEGLELAVAMERAVRAKVLLSIAVIIVAHEHPSYAFVDRQAWLREAREFLRLNDLV